jgi:CheY-like chemotaxis protein
MHADLIRAGLRALIVEDEALIAEELKGRLSLLGFRVIDMVDSADEGVAIATSELPDLVLMDIRLRGTKDGVQACEEIRRQVDVPIVYVTAHSDERSVSMGQTDGSRWFYFETLPSARIAINRRGCTPEACHPNQAEGAIALLWLRSERLELLTPTQSCLVASK